MKKDKKDLLIKKLMGLEEKIDFLTKKDSKKYQSVIKELKIQYNMTEEQIKKLK